ncbi:MAG: hypothetical protein M3R01_12500 [Actinomycetota bacterium]|nr:hypothetical protein [Actinomycetota bacterium]
MSELGSALGVGVAIATSLFAGAIAGAWLHLPPRLSATITAFGGGILLAAVALDLVPEADHQAGTVLTALGLTVGTLVFVGADALLTRDESSEMMRRSASAAAVGMEMTRVEASPDKAEEARGESIAAGIFVDGVPESIALGLTVAQGEIGLALLVGVFVGNLTEAYGATQPIVASGRSRRFATGLLGGISLALAGATVLGGTVLAGASPEFVGTAQAVAAGAVLAVISISITPYAFSEVSRLAAVASVAGFVGGYLLS